DAFAEDKAEFDSLKAELDTLVQDFQRDQAAMSDDQQVAARQKLASKNADLEYVAKKLQSLQQTNAQRVFQELVPSARQVLGEVIETDQIGLLLQAQSVIHADLGYNITAKVTDKLNQQPKE
ncbi:OmpH family outer membrane protein, partial [Luminiphilus sp.]|nr:OmpH family outer membrane protein [Luminiphilus sp.]